MVFVLKKKLSKSERRARELEYILKLIIKFKLNEASDGMKGYWTTMGKMHCRCS